MFSSLKKNFSYLEIPDVTNQIFLVLLSVIFIFSSDNLLLCILIPFLNLSLCILIIYFVSHYEKKNELEKRKRSWTRFLRFWYPSFMILFCFKEIYLIMVGFDTRLYDPELIRIDQWLFGVNPTEFLYSFNNPFLVELLQIVYGLFYLMPVIYAMELYLWHRYEELKYAIFVIFFGFYLSFLGYIIVPAIGPRFTLHEFANMNIEMPGLYFAEIIRGLINFGESIPKNVPDPELYAQRDAFPSGHTIIIILITYLSHKIRSNSFYFYLPFSILMIFSTVFLRYHYVIDLIAGIPFVIITILTANRIYKGKINFGRKLSKNISK
ncbi:MAG TPA: phosphatase PAP2 family protein [Ignavibacteria bacterium]|nr:phosphatase PAP2 family protein [Ignavibacteria bacterium]